MQELGSGIVPRRSGRPSREDAAKLADTILDAAAALFFQHGYGHVSIEEIARRAAISKRTFYARFENKAAVFREVVQRVILKSRPSDAATDALFRGATLAEILHRIGPIILHASLSDDTLALLRLVYSEAKRFPELASIMDAQGSRKEAIGRIAEVLRHHGTPGIGQSNPEFAAEQFLFMLTAAPQRRALGLGSRMDAPELEQWAHNSVELFLNGYAPRHAVH